MVEAWKGKKTVCFTLRLIEECLNVAKGSAGDPLTVIEQCDKALGYLQEAADMAKRMDAKLREYKAEYAETFYETIQSGE